MFLDGAQYDEHYDQHLARAEAARRLVDGGWRARISMALERRPGRSNSGDLALPPPPDDRLKAGLYAQQALCYEARGNASAARDSWHAAGLAAGLIGPEEAGYRTDRKYGWAAATS